MATILPTPRIRWTGDVFEYSSFRVAELVVFCVYPCALHRTPLQEDGQWYDFDDSSVSPLTASIISSNAYVLFYRRRGAAAATAATAPTAAVPAAAPGTSLPSPQQVEVEVVLGEDPAEEGEDNLAMLL